MGTLGNNTGTIYINFKRSIWHWRGKISYVQIVLLALTRDYCVR